GRHRRLHRAGFPRRPYRPVRLQPRPARGAGGDRALAGGTAGLSSAASRAGPLESSMSASAGRPGHARDIREGATAQLASLLRHARLAIAAVALALVLSPAASAADKAAID